MTRHKTYSLNLKELAKAKNTSGIMAKDKPKSANSTQVQMAQMKQNIGEWANAVFSGDQLSSMYPEPDLNKVKMNVLHSYLKKELREASRK
jgi:hypothetical protein